LIATQFSGIVFAEEGEELQKEPRDLATENERDYEPYAGFYTTAFDVDARVWENKSIDITETIHADFFEDKHGLYRYIPMTSLIVSEVDGKRLEVEEKMQVSGAKVGQLDPETGEVDWSGYSFETYTENGNFVFKIGSGSYTVTGEQIYVLRYTVKFYDDGIDEYDSIYYDFLPHGWATPIETSKVSVTFPGKDTDVSDAEFIVGYSGEANTDVFEIQPPVIDGEKDAVTVSAHLTRMLSEGEGMTFLLKLPNGFFGNELSDRGTYIFMGMLILVPLLVLLVLWIIFGRDRKTVDTVEFYPPDDLNPAAIGYLVDGKVNDKDLLAMILFWASQGYITIDEQKKGKFVLTRTDKEDSGIDGITQEMFDSLFSSGNTVDLSKRNYSFALAMKSTKKELQKEYNNSSESMFEKSSMRLRIFGIFLTMIPLIGYQSAAAMIGYGWNGYMAITSVAPILFSVIIAGIIINVFIRFNILSTLRFRVIFLILPFVSGIFPLFGWVLVSFNGTNVIFAAAAFVSTAICGFFTYHLQKRTDYYNDILGRIRGFKNFIETAEMEKLKLLFDEDPQYFYNILPYAWVFGLSDKWSEKFENLAKEPPTWYTGYYGDNHIFRATYLAHSLGRYEAKSAGRFISTPSSSGGGSGGSGGFSGGGGSFSGGGGSSGGGGGGGGGGSW
jgi:uncharacterized membrane protein YgcG